MRSRLLFISLILLSSGYLMAQEEEEEKGYVTAGFETNTIYYVKDSISGARVPDGKFGSNNYLKIDYAHGKFTAGVQVESYIPVLQGYPVQLDDVYVSMKYASFVDQGFNVRVGDFYEQFGTGLLFRSWEERTLGINTALEGINASYTYRDMISLKAIYGRAKLFNEYSDSWLRGANLFISLSEALSLDKMNLSVSGSYLDKYEPLSSSSQASLGVMENEDGYALRLDFDMAGFVFKGEYVTKDADPAFYNQFNLARGKALQLEAGYSGSGLGVNLTFRKLENMSWQSSRDEDQMFTLINYLPALTQQHTYSLANLNPYQTQNTKEIGGQLDLFYTFKRNSRIGGKRGMRTHLNFSSYYSPIVSGGDNMLFFRDLTFDAERWFGKQWKTKLLYTWQTYNPKTIGKNPDEWQSHTIVADITYKIDRKQSLRAELQHLQTANDHGNWAAASLEYAAAPRWSLTIADMWNYQDTGIHYYNGSLSYSHSKTRLALNFGRFKEGYQCSGGVCRIIPAYTGANLTLTITY